MLIKATAAPSQHVESARILIEKIRALRNEIPRFTTERLGDGRSLTAGVVPEKFLESASASIQNNTRLEEIAGADAMTLRDSYAYALAFDPVVQELKALVMFLEHSIRLQRNEAGIVALDMYNSAKRLAKRPGGAELKPFVEDMRGKLKKGRRKANPDDDTVEPAPVPSAPPKAA